MAYTKYILPYDSLEYPDGTPMEIPDSHQVSPAWCLTFLSWNNPSPKTINNPDYLGNNVLVVTNDCISLKVTYAKRDKTPMLEAVLLSGKTDYLATINAGDYLIANILNYDGEISGPGGIAERATKRQPINRSTDGFRGFFLVQSVRRMLSVSPNGAKRIAYQITAHAFSEFDSKLYFNPYIAQALPKNDILSNAFIVYRKWQDRILEKNNYSLQSIVMDLIDLIIGEGVSAQSKKAKGITFSPNDKFQAPTNLGSLLNTSNASYIKDLYRYLFGSQSYNSNGPLPDNLKGLDKGFYLTGENVEGSAMIQPEYWNQATGWSIIERYLNSPMNEMYVTLKEFPEGDVGYLYPTVVFRRTPFSSSRTLTEGERAGAKTIKTTPFHSLPRWKIDPRLVTSYSLSKDDAMRTNFVQVFGQMPGMGISNDNIIAFQLANNKPDSDPNDVKRSGLRPMVLTSQCLTPKDFLPTQRWTNIMGDIYIGSHMKLSGSIECFGIEENICVGDNLEFDGLLFHIESVSHSCEINANGSRSFRTSIQISQGVDAVTSAQGSFTVYGKTVRSYHEEETLDYQKDQILPGIVDQQYPDVINIDKTQEVTLPAIVGKIIGGNFA